MSNNHNNNQDSDSDNLFGASGNMNSLNNGANSNSQEEGFNKYQYEAVKFLEQQLMKQIQRRKLLIQQVHAFIRAEKKFKNEDFLDRRYIYLISKNWLQKWKIYSQFELISNKKMISSKNTLDQTFLPMMNSDIVDFYFQPSIKIQKSSGTEICLKQNMREDVDFIYANQEMADIFSKYQGISIRREIIQLGGQKIVDLYPLKITLILISQRILDEMKTKKKNQLITETLVFSKGGSYANLILYAFQPIVNCLNMKYFPSYQQTLTSDSHLNYFFINPTFGKEKVLKRITLSLQNQQNLKGNSICLPIQSFDYKSILSEVVGCSGPLLICEIHEQNQHSQKKILYSSDQKIYCNTKCPNCKSQLDLKTGCRCRYIAYCSEKCMNSDAQHIKRCNARLKESNKMVFDHNKNRNGLVGLVNLGNTCFMNSGIQCLSQIKELTQYFITGSYSQDINTVSNLGTKGILAKAYSQMMKNIWLGTSPTFSPHQFKRTLGGFHKNFQGNYQHDAGEFVTYLLDGLHQDLNKVKKKPYFQSKDFDNRSQITIADEQWSQFLQRNNSKIVQLMYGQFRSSVCCPSCNFKSVQFDPFLICSIPISEQYRTLSILFQDDQNMSQQNYLVPYRTSDKLSKVFQFCQKKKNLSENSKFIIYSSKTELNVDLQIDEIKMKYKSSPLYVRALDMDYQSTSENVKMIVSVKAQNQGNTSSHTLFQRMYKFKKTINFYKIHFYLYKRFQRFYQVQDYLKMITSKDLKDRQIAIFNGSQQMNTCWKCQTKCRPQTCNFPSYQKQIGSSSIVSKKIVSVDYVIRSTPTCKYEKKTFIKTNTNGLLDCFNAFQQPEILTKDNAWKCPKCKNMVNAKKHMMLYKVPRILIICLKRFKKKQYGLQKNNGLVQFPVNNLDLTDKVIKKQLPSTSSSKNGEKSSQNSQETKAIYQLFGVSYHYGDASSGHYDAACKNFTKNAWYKFDDEQVSSVNENSIVNRNAYILFYRRK